MLPDPDRSTRATVPASAYVPGGAWWGAMLVMLIYESFFGCFPYEPLYTTVPLPMLARTVRAVL